MHTKQGIIHIHHYLDDFFIAGAPDTNQCFRHLSTLTGLCKQLSIPLAEDKRKGPTTLLEYLGILLDSSALKAQLPADKLQDIKSSLARWSLRSQCTKQELLPASEDTLMLFTTFLASTLKPQSIKVYLFV